jgi:hypothetical protein
VRAKVRIWSNYQEATIYCKIDLDLALSWRNSFKLEVSVSLDAVITECRKLLLLNFILWSSVLELPPKNFFILQKKGSSYQEYHGRCTTVLDNPTSL